MVPLHFCCCVQASLLLCCLYMHNIYLDLIAVQDQSKILTSVGAVLILAQGSVLEYHQRLTISLSHLQVFHQTTSRALNHSLHCLASTVVF